MENLVLHGSRLYMIIQNDGSLFTVGEYEPNIMAMVRALNPDVRRQSYTEGYYWDNWKSWTDLLAIYCMDGSDYGFYVGLKKNGRTVAAGYNGEGQCTDINTWYNIKSVSFLLNNAVGLTYAGTLVCSGKLKNSAVWKNQNNIKKLCAGNHIVSLLKTDGTVTILRFNNDSTYAGLQQNNLSGISDIQVEDDRTYAIHNDGSVSIIGTSKFDETPITSGITIKKIVNHYAYTAALTKQGTLVFAGKVPDYFQEAKRWNNIIDFFIWNGSVIGVAANGTTNITNRDDKYYDNIPDWKREWGNTIKSWRNITAVIDFAQVCAAITTTGQILFAGNTTGSYEYRTLCRSGIATYSVDQYRTLREQSEQLAKAEADKINRERQMADFRNKRVCQHCGGTFKGFFVKTCIKCGKRKDY